jgi:serine/threonine-protein kinase
MGQVYLAEAQAASALNHPNILTIYEVGESGGTHFIASEYVEGETVHHKLSAGRLRLADAIDIALQIAAGSARGARGRHRPSRH